MRRDGGTVRRCGPTAARRIAFRTCCTPRRWPARHRGERQPLAAGPPGPALRVFALGYRRPDVRPFRVLSFRRQDRAVLRRLFRGRGAARELQRRPNNDVYGVGLRQVLGAVGDERGRHLPHVWACRRRSRAGHRQEPSTCASWQPARGSLGRHACSVAFQTADGAARWLPRLAAGGWCSCSCDSAPLRRQVDSVGCRYIRAVAQLGSALVWGTRGRRFKSCQPDE